MANVGSKTPVSILQEYCVSKNISITYEFINRSGTSHEPLFVYRVSAGQKTAEGEGRSKKDAKHTAAKNMLEMLNLRNNAEVADSFEDVSLPQESEVGYNAVGELLDYCSKYNNPEPSYREVNAEGPPHARIFTTECAVSTLKELGTSRTKKQAKQISAHRMLNRLKKERGEEVDALVPIHKSPEKVFVPPAPGIPLEQSLEKYSNIKGVNVNTQPNAVLYKDHERAFVGMHEKSPTLSNIIEKGANDDDQFYDIIKIISNELSYAVHETETLCKENNETVMLVSLNTMPPLTTMGSTLNEASKSMIDTLCLMCR